MVKKQTTKLRGMDSDIWYEPGKTIVIGDNATFSRFDSNQVCVYIRVITPSCEKQGNNDYIISSMSAPIIIICNKKSLRNITEKKKRSNEYSIYLSCG